MITNNLVKTTMDNLISAIKYRNFALAEKIISDAKDGNADVNFRDKHGSTPLHFAASSGYVDIVNKLISAGADVNARNVHGDTPLHNVVYYNRLNIVEILTEAGADLFISNNNGLTPMDVAIRYKNTKIILYLLEMIEHQNLVKEPDMD